MIDRIKQIMDSHGMNQATFADRIGVGRSTFHHIISGRNNPGLEVIMKICDSFPDVKLDWLLKGDGEYVPQNVVPDDLFSSLSDNNEEITTPEPVSECSKTEQNSQQEFTKIIPTQQIDNEEVKPQNSVTLPLSEFNILKELSTQAQNRKIEKIMVLYSDGTFQNFQSN